MHGFPKNLDLSAAIGQETTQFRIGPYDLQFSFGEVSFAVQSQVELWRNSPIIATWQSGEWPSAEFYKALCAAVTSVCIIDNERRLCIALNNGLELHILDNSDQYESLQIYVSGSMPYIV